MPAANAYGYSHNTRTEGNVDPNRDFPYGNTRAATDQCMVTSAARAINEMFVAHKPPKTPLLLPALSP
jgi:hypothetical protein